MNEEYEDVVSSTDEDMLTMENRDKLRELASLATCSAVSTLSDYLSTTVKLGMPFMDILPAKSLPIFENDPANHSAMIFQAKISGYISGSVLMIFPDKSGMAFFDILSQKHNEKKDSSKNILNEMRDIGREMMESYVQCISDFLKIKLKIDNMQIMSSKGSDLLTELNISDDSMALMLEADFAIPGTNFEGDFIVFAKRDETNSLISRLDC